MTMFHHGSEPYDVAVSNAAKHFQQKLEQLVHVSVPRVERVIEQVHNDQPTDMIGLGKKLTFGVQKEGATTNTALVVNVPGNGALALHDHALGQIADRVKVRNLRTVINELRGRGDWGNELIAHNLNELYSHLNGDRFLLRSVRHELRGFMSDSYRRLDSRPLLDAFVGSIAKFGARPYDGFALQTKVNVRAIIPMMFEPFPGEIMAFGAQLGDSDYGDGTLFVSGFCLRMVCTNLATTEDVLKQVHLGRKLSDTVEFSRKTVELDTRTMASAINDVIGHVLSPAAVNRYTSLVRKANEQKIEPDKIHAWAKKNLSKTEGEAAVSKFTSPDVENLPPGQTSWRWSNALSWLANETKDEHRKLELQEFAGSILK
jgi:hypothetical protein